MAVDVPWLLAHTGESGCEVRVVAHQVEPALVHPDVGIQLRISQILLFHHAATSAATSAIVWLTADQHAGIL